MDATLQLIIETAIAVLLFCTLIALLYTARKPVTKPLPKMDGAELFAVIAASGTAEQLEQTVQGLLWLNKNGEMESRVIIADCGLEEQPKKIANILAKETGRVTYCSPGDLPLVLEENGWTGAENT